MATDVAIFATSVAVVVGATGGIGQALVAALQADDRFSEVIAFSRSGALPIDLLNEQSIAEAAKLAAARGAIRLVIDATGFLHDADYAPEKAISQIDPAHLRKSFAINAIGPALLMKQFLPRLASSGRSVFATLSARVGSIGDNELGGWYSYRASKAALNQLVRTASIELKRRRPAAICVALHPGTVATSLSAPFAKSNLDLRSPSQAAAALLKSIDRLNPSDPGASSTTTVSRSSGSHAQERERLR